VAGIGAGIGVGVGVGRLVGMVAGVVVVVGVAGDQDPGDGPVTSQPPTPLPIQESGLAELTAHAAGVAEQAGQLDGDQQLGPDPAGLGQPTPLQDPAGHLGQGIRGPLGPLRLSWASAGWARGSNAARTS
jgi:hypothetical protein